MGKRKSQEVRIIGGKWKGRKLRFQSAPNLRPTVGRLRETLFNWLRPDIDDARCLDLFAGSGILGFEALSQGARSVDFVDHSRKSCAKLAEHIELLGCQAQSQVFCRKAQVHLKTAALSWDIVFLDPPYDDHDVMLAAIEYFASLTEPPEWLYIEGRDRNALDELFVSFGLNVAKDSRTGDAHGHLCYF